MSIVNVDTAEINGVDGGTTVTRFDGQIDRWINTRIGGTQWVMIFERHLKVEFDLSMMCCQEEGKEVHEPSNELLRGTPDCSV